MARPSNWSLIPFILIAASAGLVLLQLARPGGEAEASSKSGRVSPARATAAIPSPPLPGEGPVPSAPEIAPELRKQLDSLRACYRNDRLSVAGIRLQGELDVLWADGPPLDLLLSEVGDHEAPLSYRLHMAKRLRNAAKESGLAEREAVASSLRGMIGQPAPSVEASVALASVLTSLEASAATIRTVVKVAEDAPSDALRAAAIAALGQAGEESAGEVWRMARQLAADPERNHQALATALPPLARRGDLRVEEILQTIVDSSPEYPVATMVLEAVAVRAPSPESIGLAIAIWDRAEGYSKREQAVVRQACRHILGRHEAVLRADPSLVPAIPEEKLESILSNPAPKS